MSLSSEPFGHLDEEDDDDGMQEKGWVGFKSVVHEGDIPIIGELLKKTSIISKRIMCRDVCNSVWLVFTSAGKCSQLTDQSETIHVELRHRQFARIFLAGIPEVLPAGKKIGSFIMQANQYTFHSKFENENLVSHSVLAIFFTYPSKWVLVIYPLPFYKIESPFWIVDERHLLVFRSRFLWCHATLRDIPKTGCGGDQCFLWGWSFWIASMSAFFLLLSALILLLKIKMYICASFLFPGLESLQKMAS